MYVKRTDRYHSNTMAAGATVSDSGSATVVNKWLNHYQAHTHIPDTDTTAMPKSGYSTTSMTSLLTCSVAMPSPVVQHIRSSAAWRGSTAAARCSSGVTPSSCCSSGSGSTISSSLLAMPSASRNEPHPLMATVAGLAMTCGDIIADDYDDDVDDVVKDVKLPDAATSVYSSKCAEMSSGNLSGSSSNIGAGKTRKPLTLTTSVDSDTTIGGYRVGGTLRDVSPSTTLQRRHGVVLGSSNSTSSTASSVQSASIDTGQRFRAAPNFRGQNRLQSLFSTFKTQDKQEQLTELLAGYTFSGLPKIPDLLTLGRPHYDPSAFFLEPNWTDIVEGHHSLTKRQRDQQEAIWELLNTEVGYITQLRGVIDVFMCCLLDLQNEQLLNEIECEKVFSNVVDVYYATCHFWVNHMSQVVRLSRETKDTLDPCLLKAGFLVFDKIFDPYVKYCLEQEMCREYIKTKTKENEQFRAFIEWGEAQQQCNRLKMVDLIVKPWQRLTKYKLLLFAMKKPLDKMEPTPDVEEQRSDIAEMMEQVEKFVNKVNMAMRQRHEHKQLSQMVERIESYDAVEVPTDECIRLVSEFCKLDLTCRIPGCGPQEMRILLLEGGLKLKDTYSKADVYCFLFTDMLLITKPVAKRGDKVKVIKPPMRLDKVVVHSLRDSASFMLLHLNEYHMAQSIFTFFGDSKLWLESILKAQIDYKEKRRQYLTRNESIFVDTYDDNDDDLLSTTSSSVNFKEIQRRPAVVDVLNRQESDSVPDSFMPNIATGSTSSMSSLTVYRSASYSDNNPSASLTSDPGVGGSNSNGGLSGPAVLQRPHSATVLTTSESANMASSLCVSTSPSPSDDVATETKSRLSHVSTPTETVTIRLSNSDEAESEINSDEGDASLHRSRLNQRRNGRSERRYHTADTIREIEKRRETQTSGIHKRLSLNYSGNGTGSVSKPTSCRSDDDVVDRSYDPSVSSAESMHSVRSSSGVSSAASLCRGAVAGTDDISEETVDDVLEADCRCVPETELVDRDAVKRRNNYYTRDDVNDDCSRSGCSVDDDDGRFTDQRQPDAMPDDGSGAPTSRIRRRPTPGQTIMSKSGRLAVAASNNDKKPPATAICSDLEVS